MRRIETTSREWALGAWTLHRAVPAPHLAPCLVGGYVGFAEQTVRPLARREVATLRIPLIFNLGAPYLVSLGADPVPTAFSSFVAGASDGPAVVQGATHSCALQVDLTPLGARALLGLPLDELTNRVVALDDVLGPAARECVERLGEATAWDARFDIIEGFLERRLTTVRAVDARVRHVWSRLEATGGQARIEELARDVGWSRKHLGMQFRTAVGLTPKTAARVMRFESLLARARHRGHRTWSELAATCGYFDQAHLNRDFAAFAHTTPMAYLADLVPGDAGLLAEGHDGDREHR